MHLLDVSLRLKLVQNQAEKKNGHDRVKPPPSNKPFIRSQSHLFIPVVLFERETSSSFERCDILSVLPGVCLSCPLVCCFPSVHSLCLPNVLKHTEKSVC